VFRFKWFLPVLAIAVIVVVAVVLLLPPRVTVNAQGTVAISNTSAPQLDIILISDIPAYGVIEKSGCGEFKGKVKIRIDCFLTPESEYYSQYGGAYVVDTTSKEYLAGYKGELDKEGNPVNQKDYDIWWDSLPTVWQDNPFHSHFVYYDTTVLDDSIKAETARVTEYFYAFHTYCWDNELTFLSQWVKVPKQAGTIRDVFIAGDSSPPNKSACELKAIEITSRTTEFDTREFDKTPSPPTDLNIGEKGTIDIGTGAVIGDSYWVAPNYTTISTGNPANADGTIDTFEIYPHTSQSGVKVGTFSGGSGTFNNRDYELIGTVTAGAPDPDVFTGLSCDVLTDDVIGFVLTGGAIKVTTGGTAMWFKSGDQFGTGAQTYSRAADNAISLYGTGTESGGNPDISNTPAIWEVGTVATSTDYWSSGSGPEWPLDDGECHFTVTNNGDACSMTIKATNFTGGVGWTLAGSPAENTVTMKAGKSGDANEGAFITLTTSEQSFISGLAGSGTKKWELMMESSTNHTDGALKTATITLTATLD